MTLEDSMISITASNIREVLNNNIKSLIYLNNII